MRGEQQAGRGTWWLGAAALAVVMLTAACAPSGGGTAVRGATPSALSAPVDVDPALRSATGDVDLIVQERDGAGSEARDIVEELGGGVTTQLPLINGFAATLPASGVEALAAASSVRALTLDRDVTVQSSGTSSAIKSAYPKTVNADRLWSAGISGAGVTVALVDTGITEVQDLAGRILPVTDDLTGDVTACMNMSGEDHCNDSYGHGTFLAGIIAGSGAASSGKWKGVAPGANLVSVKIAGRDGASDVSNVLAAIQWVVSFKDKYGIKVLNLSLGTDGTQSYRTDPLNYAVQKAWDNGITVVVSASNRGPEAGSIAKPGDDPLVITVGATDDRGTPALTDDRLPDFSGRGPTLADGLDKPDVAAPGAHIVSLRAPGSAIDTLVPVYVDGAYRRGSGTSMSAAVVSGSAALLAQSHPSWTPDRVKFALMRGAVDVAGGTAHEVGAGQVDLKNTVAAPAGLANVGVDRSSGLGSLDASRGTVQVQADDPLATVVSGLLTAQLLLFDPLAYTGTEWTGAKWYGAKWYGAKWYGAKWYGAKWYGAKWYGAKWYGGSDAVEGYGSEWEGAKWYGAWE